jgi:hypothetical protein
MASRSQLIEQIMENQTRFDLNAAIESWRQELAAQPNLASDDRRELETHLGDAIAGFQQRGLNDEESFWLARRRVGRPQQLGEEFVKADPAKAWRERIFWMALGIIVFWQLTLILTFAAGIALYYLFPGLHEFYVKSGFWPTDAVVLIIGIALARGWFAQSMKLMWFLKNRFHLVSIVVVLALLLSLTQTEFSRESFLHNGRYPSVVTWAWAPWLENALHFLLGYLAHNVAPLIFLVLFFPAQNQKTPKRS